MASRWYWRTHSREDQKMTTPLSNRVAKGAAVLDAVRPYWWREIDHKNLLMDDGCSCILGQIYGEYTKGVLFLRQSSSLSVGRYGVVFGFSLSEAESEETPEEWATLEALWKEEIITRMD